MVTVWTLGLFFIFLKGDYAALDLAASCECAVSSTFDSIDLSVDSAWTLLALACGHLEVMYSVSSLVRDVAVVSSIELGRMTSITESVGMVIAAAGETFVFFGVLIASSHSYHDAALVGDESSRWMVFPELIATDGVSHG